VFSALVVVELIRAANSGDALNVGWFALFVVVAVALLVAAARLWAGGRPG
jgi:hypothetical protein